MIDLSSLEDVFPPDADFPYDRSFQQEVEARRRSLDGHHGLFIDRILSAVGITKAKTYPPKSNDALRQLHKQINESAMTTQHKLSLLYYLLLDFDTVNGRSAVSSSFAESMPETYQIFMKGLWFLDRKQFEESLEYITHPSLVAADFADDIISVLVRHAPKHDYTLALAYYHTVQPILKTSAALELLFGAVARTNVSEALIFSRGYSDHARERLFRQLLASILEMNDEGGANAAGIMGELAFLPLDGTEEAWFEEYLTTGEGKNAKRARETLLVRKIAGDKFEEVSEWNVTGGQWGTVLQGIRRAVDAAATE